MPTELLKPRDYQEQAIDAIVKGWDGGLFRTAVVLPTGAGKGHPLDTLVPTPMGMRRWGDLAVDDQVYGSDGRPTRVTKIFERGTLPTYRVSFSDGASVQVDGDHLWNVRTKHDKADNKGYRTLSTIEIAKRLNVGWFVPMTPAVFHWHKQLPIDPYVMGVLLGDGGLSVDGRVLITCQRDTAGIVESLLPAGVTLKEMADAGGGAATFIIGAGPGRSDNPIMTALRTYGLMGSTAWTKFIPDDYLTASIDQRIALLQGLCDTDGYVTGRGGSVEHVTVSERLADDVVGLVTSLGGKARYRRKQTTYTYNDERFHSLAYRATLALPLDVTPVRVERKAQQYKPVTKYMPTRRIVSIEPVQAQPIRCITVDADDSLYLIGRDHIVTHNTVVFAHLAERWYAEHKTRVLILVHTEELVAQAIKKLHDVAPHLIVGEISGRVKRHAGAHVIVATRQTLGRSDKKAKMLRDSLGAIGLIIIDECHHATARQYRVILDHFGALDLDDNDKDSGDHYIDDTHSLPAAGSTSDNARAIERVNKQERSRARVVGFTATLVRGDGASLGEVWQKVVFKRDILFMIERVYLLPARGKRIVVKDLDFRDLKTSRGDYQAGDLGEALTESLAPELVAKAYKEHASDRSGLIFTPTVESAHVFAEALRAEGITCEVVHGKTPKEERRLILKRLESGELQTVANCMVLTEGFDCPRVSCAVIARPTTSVGLYIQMLGRILRPYPGQTDALLIDVVGVSGRHKLASLVDLVGDATKRAKGTDDEENLADLLLTADGLFLDGPELGSSTLPPPEWQYGETVSFDVDLFARSRSTWLTTAGGAWCMPAGKHVVFLAPDGGSGRWSVAVVESGSGRGDVAYRNLSQDAAMSWGERVAEDLGAGPLNKRAAKWRMEKPRETQVTRARYLGIPVTDETTRGELSDKITITYASHVIDPYITAWK